MKLRYYDRPMEQYKNVLAEHEATGDYVFQYKVDGWQTSFFRDKSRKLVSTWGGSPTWGRGSDGSLFFVSRRAKKQGGPTQIPVSDEIIEAAQRLDLPDQSMLATEWMARRTIGECPEKLFVFDLMFLDNEWQGDDLLRQRMKKLNGIMSPFPFVRETPALEALQFFTKDFVSTFEKIATDPAFAWTEGLVLKHLDSVIKGDNEKGVDNALLIKVKWRSGSSGRDIVR